ncbi:hypothetical protein [Methylomonas sp. MgM2]
MPDTIGGNDVIRNWFNFQLGNVQMKMSLSANGFNLTIRRNARWLLRLAVLLVTFINLEFSYSQEKHADGISETNQDNVKVDLVMEKNKDFLFDTCKYNPIHYAKIKAEIEKAYPKESSSKLLLNSLSNFEKKIDAKPCTDFVALNENGLLPSRDELKSKTKLGKRWEPPTNAKLYWFTKRCSEPNGNETNWSIFLLSDIEDKITAIQLNPFMDNDKNFAARHIKLNFDYFSGPKAMQVVLQSLIKPGTDRQKVFEFMDNNVEAGIYSKIFRKREQGITLKGSKGSTFGYTSIDEPEITMRIRPFEYKTIISLDFDKSDRLVEVCVVR